VRQHWGASLGVQWGFTAWWRSVCADKWVTAGLIRVRVALLISRARRGFAGESAGVSVVLVLCAAALGWVVALTVAYGLVKLGVLKEPTVVETSEYQIQSNAVVGWLVGQHILLQVVYTTVFHEDFCRDFAGWVEAFRRLLDHGEEALMVAGPRGWA
jgi:hypothetical protein